MAARPDRVTELFEGRRRKIHRIVTPEGIALDVEIADRGERLGAFLIDMMFWLGGTIAIYVVLLFAFISGMRSTIAITAVLFVAFLLRNLYFIHFELAWQGSTPGKRFTGLKVIERHGGELTPGAIVARNLTREVEFFMPMSFLLSLPGSGGGTETWQNLSLLVWALAISGLPLFNRENLRAGDLIGGTLVITLPKRALAQDLTAAPSSSFSNKPKATVFVFTRSQLQAYGAYELQVLEELLRRPGSEETNRLHREIAQKIATKIRWPDRVAESEALRFLEDFYAAERAELERGQLFGQYKDDKASGTRKA